MEIISHRGFWITEEEKNSLAAFERSFKLGLGIETDLRDLNGQLVISHEVATEGALSFDEVLGIYKKYNCNGTLALNVKSDGLQLLIKQKLALYNITSYFLFDMSVPDLKKSLREKLVTYTRFSDVEPFPSYLEDCAGIWVDSMESDWLTQEDLEKLDKSNKKLCFVSNELHRRPYENLWSKLSKRPDSKNYILCTDFPDKALTYFGMNNEN